MKTLTFAFLAIAVFSSGCSLKTSIEDLKPIVPLQSSASPIAMKISGGSEQNFSGPNVTLDVTISPTAQILRGVAYDMDVTISGHRPISQQ